MKYLLLPLFLMLMAGCSNKTETPTSDPAQNKNSKPGPSAGNGSSGNSNQQIDPCAQNFNIPVSGTKNSPALLQALRSADLAEVCTLAKSGIGTAYADPKTGVTPLHYLLGDDGNGAGVWSTPSSNQAALIRLFAKNGADVNSITKDGRTILGDAAAQNYLDSVQALLDVGAAVNKVDATGRTALSYSVRIPFGPGYHDQLEITQALLAHGANPNFVDHDGSILALACAFQHPELIDPLIASGADLTRSGQDCLQWSLQSRFDIDAAIKMVSLNVDPKPTFISAVELFFNPDYRLKAAEIKKLPLLIQLDAQKGADSETLPANEFPGLIRDVIGNNISSVKKRIAAGENLDVRDSHSNMNALMVASILDREQIQDALLAAKVDPFIRSKTYQNGSWITFDAFTLAAGYSPDKALPNLMKKADVNKSLLDLGIAVSLNAMSAVPTLAQAQGSAFATRYDLIYYAIQLRSISLLDQLFSLGLQLPDPNDKKNTNPLLAVVEGCAYQNESICLPLIKWLFQHGAKPTDSSIAGRALYWRFANIFSEVIKAGGKLDPESIPAAFVFPVDGEGGIYLDDKGDLISSVLDKGIDPNTPYSYGRTLTLLISREFGLKANQALRQHGGRADLVDFQGNGVLVGVRSPEVIDFWISQGAKVDQLDSQGQTPLMSAVRHQEWNSAYLALIAAGADVNARDKSGKSVLQFAREVCFDHVSCGPVVALIAAGAH